MSRAYGNDLRNRVLDAADAGASARSVAARFEIGVATAIVWIRRARDRRAHGPSSGQAARFTP